jgi:hypothetical protein
MSQDGPVPSSPPRWSATPRGCRELMAAALFCLICLLVPLCTTDLYPFSQAPMFADAPQHYCDYSLTDADGRPLPLADFGLQRNYWGNPLGVGVGYHPPESVDRFGTVATEDEVTAFLRRRLARHPELRSVHVTQAVIGDVDGQHVGSVEKKTWTIDNPHYRGADRR